MMSPQQYRLNGGTGFFFFYEWISRTFQPAAYTLVVLKSIRFSILTYEHCWSLWTLARSLQDYKGSYIECIHPYLTERPFQQGHEWGWYARKGVSGLVCWMNFWRGASPTTWPGWEGLKHHSGPSGLFSRLYSWVFPTFQLIRASMATPITLNITCNPRYLQPANIIFLNITNIIIIYWHYITHPLSLPQ